MVWRWVLFLTAIWWLTRILLGSGARCRHERYNSLDNSAVLGSWVSDDNTTRITFLDDRGKVTMEQSGKPTETAYYVMDQNDANKGSASNNINRKWTFSVANNQLTWKNGDGSPIVLKKA